MEGSEINRYKSAFIRNTLGDGNVLLLLKLPIEGTVWPL